MKALLITTALAISMAGSWNSQRTYNKIQKKYQKDSDMCFDYAKKLIDKKPESPVPYYFVSLIYSDRSEKSKYIKGEFMNLNRSALYAIRFLERSNDEDKAIVNWAEHLTTLKYKSSILMTKLEKQGLFAELQELTARMDIIESRETSIVDSPIFVIKDKATETELIMNFEETTIPKTKNELFFGMPTGNEMVVSRDLGEEKLLFQLINEQRTKLKLEPLIWEEDLARAGRYHAYDQGTQEYFDHDTYDLVNGKLVKVGSTFERISKFSLGANGECIAAGSSSAESTLNQWLNSPEHRAIVLHKDIKKVGIGFVQVADSPFEYYWVLITKD